MSTIKFEDLTSKDAQGNIIIDVNSPQLSGKEIPVVTGKGEYRIKYWEYNDTRCYSCVDKKDPSIRWVLPTKERYVSSPYGTRTHPKTGKPNSFHAGIDLCDPSSDNDQYTPILAARPGKVTVANYHYSAGHQIKIEHYKDDDIKGTPDGFATVYMHMGYKTDMAEYDDRYAHIVKVGQYVTAGQIIGSMGTSGSSTGYHLHFGICENGNYINPAERIDFKTNELDDISSIDLYVQKESFHHDDFTPIFCSNNKLDYGVITPQQMHTRRGQLIGDSYISLFDMGKIDRRLSSGSSCIGPNSNNSYVKEETKKTDSYLTATINPYISSSSSYNNNAFVWARAMRILGISTNSTKSNSLLCRNRSENWYKYNAENKLFEYGTVPRKYAIACWEYLGKNNVEKTRLAIVEDVFSTDYISVSEYPHKKSGEYPLWNNIDEKNLNTKRMTNPDYNWGQSKSTYKFLGFIYLLNLDEINSDSINVMDNGSITIVADANNRYSTVVVGAKDAKHYNKVRIIYDITTHSMVGKKAGLTCGINISASNQVVNCKTTDENWRATGFDLDNSLDPYNTARTRNYPFPMGSLQLHDENLMGLIDKGKVERDSIFKLNECSFNNKIVNPFSIDGYTSLNRNLPLYISITPISYDTENGSSATVEVNIKKIILYR